MNFIVSSKSQLFGPIARTAENNAENYLHSIKQ